MILNIKHTYKKIHDNIRYTNSIKNTELYGKYKISILHICIVIAYANTENYVIIINKDSRRDAQCIKLSMYNLFLPLKISAIVTNIAITNIACSIICLF